ncbi:SRPBCC family protein [Phenylobacterium sp.]|uniref:SRPBCC family protein n=1 Tax=Phenylobacterium sp. TaxID=1871053 RepID=UPI002C6A6B2E|nr:SRPBCC family protein [Phenylobacterium sp.]HLZ75728.1 SRPBCC family protein [Phenylobacterium sp.]
MRTLLLIGALAVGVLAAAASAACAAELPERAQAQLARGRPFVEVSPAADGSSGVILAAIDVAAPQAVVFAVMTDCDLAPKMVANLKSCRVLERDPQGRWDVREEISKMTFAPSVRTVYREDFEPPRAMAFHSTGGDLKIFEGDWKLEPHGDQVRVTYQARVAAPFAVPGWVARLALRHDVPMALLALRREALARAPAP